MEVVAINQISPDQVILFTWGFVTISATLIYTWLVMGILVVGSMAITRNLSTDRTLSRWQNLLEVIVGAIRSEIREVVKEGGDYVFSPYRHPVSLHPVFQPLYFHSRLRGAHFVPYGPPRPLRS